MSCVVQGAGCMCVVHRAASAVLGGLVRHRAVWRLPCITSTARGGIMLFLSCYVEHDSMPAVTACQRRSVLLWTQLALSAAGL
jgi:hypothetical protein